MKRNRKRKLVSGGALVAALSALGVGQALLQRHAEAQGRASGRRASRSIRCGPSRCRITGCSGMTIGVGVDRRITSGSSIAARPRSTQRNRARRPNPPPTRSAARAAPPVLEFDQQGNLVHATGAARPARATSGRSRTTASPSTTRATSGSAATAPTTAHILKFTQDGKFLMQFGKFACASAGSNDLEHFGTVAKISSTSQGERGVRRRRLRQQARRRDRHGHRQDQALLGRVRQQAGRHATSAATTPTRRPRSSSATRCTAPSCRTTASSTSATASTIASRCSRRTASS